MSERERIIEAVTRLYTDDLTEREFEADYSVVISNYSRQSLLDALASFVLAGRAPNRWWPR